MDFLDTQLGKVLEEVKIAMLSHVPVVYIPTDQLEFINELIYGEYTADSLIPRVCYKASQGAVTKLSIGETGVDSSDGKFSSIQDNYVVGSIEPDRIKIPSLLVSYAKDWTSIHSSVKSFIVSYLGIKSSGNYTDPKHTDVVQRSLCIVVMAQELTIPSDIAPYVRTVRVPSLSDQEILDTINATLDRNNLEKDIIDSQLLSQMIISMRGFSKYKIEQLLMQLIAQQSVDADGVNPQEVIETIRLSKKQMLDNSLGLKWEANKDVEAAGLGEISKWLFQRKEIFSDPQKAVAQHMDIPKGVLVSGIPGSGKSLMAKTAASILEVPLVSLDMGALLGGLMGESEHNMIAALKMAEQMSPCVLWIDEIEKAFSGSSQGSSASDGGVGRRMFGKFLTWMQEKSAACFVFATSNDITCLPPELFRSERFDKKFFTFMPTADECAEIFASNIKSQNKSYIKDLLKLTVSQQAKQAKQLFPKSLEESDIWLNILNEYALSHKGDFDLINRNEDKKNGNTPLYVWNTSCRPKYKLMTGADISTVIREAKFKIHPTPVSSSFPTVLYDEHQMLNAVRNILNSHDFKPYGETNLKDIVKCFINLYENEFVPASGACILDFDDYDSDEMIYQHNQDHISFKNHYDSILYCTIVGAINHYTKEVKLH